MCFNWDKLTNRIKTGFVEGGDLLCASKSAQKRAKNRRRVPQPGAAHSENGTALAFCPGFTVVLEE
eukprot:3087669-Rhodomonas_salina.2